MLNVTALKKHFGKNTILHDVTFAAEKNQLTILEGKNGAGKSTLFSIIAGLLQPDAGSITLENRTLNDTSACTRAHAIALLRQDPKACCIDSLSVLENLALALLKGTRARFVNATSVKKQQRIHEHLLTLGITFLNDLTKPMGMLSGGQRQIMAFAMATIVQPKVLLLDEPTAALDEQSSHLLMTLIKQFIAAHNIPAVMISHDHDLNSTYGDVIYVLEQGRVQKKAA